MLQLWTQMLVPYELSIRWGQRFYQKLHCRLVKAEKRVSQMKQKEDLLEAQIATAREIAAEANSAGPETPDKSRVSKPEQPVSRKRKQRQLKPKKPVKAKRHRLESDKASESATSGEQESCAEDSDSTEEEEDIEDSSRGEGGDSEGEGRKDPVKREDEEGDSDNEETVDEAQDVDKDPHPEPVLRTECLYHVSCCVEQPPEELVECPEEEKEVIIGDFVETPGWRINVLTNRYQLEGTENITDEAYQKRHQKHEMEEKRRKRWDIQRMREQRVFEKLKNQEAAAACSSQDAQPQKTFLPNIEDLTHIEILESVAVTAFGHAVPHIEPSEFELPWDTGPSSSFTRKSHGGRGRQK